jgi:hypothetical protein
MLATCQFKGCKDERKSELNATDTLFLNQWRKEKVEKTKLITSYENSIRKLQFAKDSLLKDVQLKKQSIASFRFKTARYEDLLREHLASSDTVNRKEAKLMLDSLLVSQSNSDTACDETIHQLETVIVNRDSVIALHETVEFNLKEIQKTNELETTFLTAQLNDSKKNLRRKTRQNKILAGGLILLSGIASSLLITQHLK